MECAQPTFYSNHLYNFRNFLKHKSEVRWLEQNYINIKYSDGFVHLDCIADILNRICNSYDIIYVKGHQKMCFLQKYVDLEVVNLEGMSDVPNLVKTRNACFYHCADKLSMCTERNIEILLNYVKCCIVNKSVYK